MSSVRGKKETPVTTNILEFLKERVLSVSDITRTKKLSEILNEYADKKSSEIFIVQNTKKKNAQAVISDLEYFQELLSYKETVDSSIDDLMYEIAFERKDDTADISLSQIISGNALDIERIFEMVDEVEEDS